MRSVLLFSLLLTGCKLSVGINVNSKPTQKLEVVEIACVAGSVMIRPDGNRDFMYKLDQFGRPEKCE